MKSDDLSPLFCDRCVRELTPGQGNFYVVKIEALADPTPPSFTEADLEHDVHGEMQKLMDELHGLPQLEAIEQVHRRLSLFLCTSCYEQWIEDPTG